MPNYDFLNKETGEIKEYFMSYKDLDEFKKNNPHLLQQVSAPNIVGGHGDRVKTDDGFKEVLSKVGDAHPGSVVHERHGSKDIKREKTVQTIKKHVDIQSKRK
jgi:CO dehydrogenase/acetyl-CoA synthase delta subunit|tara:strand:+ start:13758 stop:14066 length:309 start_codon:yes stop_codon:yes gene_type:complete